MFRCCYFGTLSLISLYKAIFNNQKWHWILAGVFMGLAFDSKYTALLLQIGLLAFLVFSNPYRKLLISPWLWFSLVISVLITFPVWWWNYQNEFASFAFQGSNRTVVISEFKIYPEYFFGAIGHQLLLLIPVLFAVFITFTFKYIKRAFLKFKLPKSKNVILTCIFCSNFCWVFYHKHQFIG